MKRPLLLEVLAGEREPGALDESQWELLIRQARPSLLLSRLAELPGMEQAPATARRHLDSARILGRAHHQSLAWELERLAEALAGTGYPVVLLKGAAYAALELPVARGRLFGDIDLMVPRTALADAERRLHRHGWLPVHMDAYDRRYFRQWMHEVPALKHVRRRSTIDLHHTILPPTSRFHCHTQALFDTALPLEDTPFSTLCAEDLVLHSAAHLYTEGELEHGLRDLVDLDGLLRHFAGADRRPSAVGCRQSAHNPGPTANGQQPAASFHTSLVARANATGLGRPLAHALRHCRDLLATPLPAGLEETIEDRPGSPAALLLDACYRRALLPYHPSCRSTARSLAEFLLYLRGHWLRMPMHLLLPHLAHKAWKRRFGRPVAVRGEG